MTEALVKEILKDVSLLQEVISPIQREVLHQKSYNSSLYPFHKTAKCRKENELVYLSSLNNLVNKAKASEGTRSDRTTTGTYSTFGAQCVYDLRKGFPLLTSKKISFKNVLLELIWFLSGNTDNTWLTERGVNIWSDWANDQGELGPIYGKMWRCWGEGEVDQIQNLINTLKNDPYSRRMIVTGWDPDLLPDPEEGHSTNIRNGKQVLPPCHTMWQVYIEDRPIREVMSEMKASNRIPSSVKRQLKGFSIESLTSLADSVGIPLKYLDLKLYQRSGDIFLGVPYNIASYATLMIILSSISMALPRYFIHTFGDLHLYSNHLDQAKEQLSRPIHDSPVLYPNIGDSSFYELSSYLDNPYTCLSLLDYKPEAPISAPIAV